MQGASFTRPVWAEISRGRLIANYRALRALVPPRVGVLAVVKANAYGHGVDLCAPIIAAAGAEWLGITSVEEGVRVRALCPQQQILVMSGLNAGEAADALDSRLCPVVWESYHLDLLEEEAARRGLPPQSIPVHLELDTGMARQGVPVADSCPDSCRPDSCRPESCRPESLPELSALLARFHTRSPLRLDAVMTHFHSPEALSDTPGATQDTANPQIAKLGAALEVIRTHGLRPTLLHAGNSATLLAGPDRTALEHLALAAGMHLMLRPGLALYGYAPDFQPPQQLRARLEPVLAWKTRITSLRTLQPGATAGYNATFRASRVTRLALLPVGYADGYSRQLSNRGQVLLRGRRAPVAGRVSMDQITVDVTEIPNAAIGDEVVLLGEQGDDSISAAELGVLTGTIPYEVLCDIDARVPRVLVD
jgi:alanine racemase